MTESFYPFLAKQFVDMWQQQLSHMLTDEQCVNRMIDLMHQYTQPTGEDGHASPNGNHAASAQRSKNAAVPPDAANAAVVALERRLAASEARIAELEREMAELRRNPPPAGSNRVSGRRTERTGAPKRKIDQGR